MFGPAAMPRDLVAKVNADIAAVLAAPDIKERLASSGAEPAPTSPEELGKLVREEMAKWAKVVAESGARVD
jgi:tripartite-type tricarboxylate transporter receptor subunit TctC